MKFQGYPVIELLNVMIVQSMMDKVWSLLSPSLLHKQYPTSLLFLSISWMTFFSTFARILRLLLDWEFLFFEILHRIGSSSKLASVAN